MIAMRTPIILIQKRKFLTVEVLNSRSIQKLAQDIPSDRILVETDNPEAPSGFSELKEDLDYLSISLRKLLS